MRVDLHLCDRRCYTFEAYAARHLLDYFERKKIAHQCIYMHDGALQEYFFYIQNHPPTWTLSFENITPHQKAYCDVVGVPHFLWLNGSLAHGVHYLTSSLGKVGIGDDALCQKLQAKNVFFLPPGIEKNQECEDKLFDLVLFADLIDLNFLEATLRELFEEESICQIHKAIEQKDPLMAMGYFFYVEQYLAAQKTLHDVFALPSVRLDVFGRHAGSKWLVKLPETVHLHAQLSYIEYLQVLKSSKMILCGPTSPWYWPAVAAGCLPVDANEESVVKDYLAHPEKRKADLQALQDMTCEKQWDNQIKTLVELMQR